MFSVSWWSSSLRSYSQLLGMLHFLQYMNECKHCCHLRLYNDVGDPLGVILCSRRVYENSLECLKKNKKKTGEHGLLFGIFFWLALLGLSTAVFAPSWHSRVLLPQDTFITSLVHKCGIRAIAVQAFVSLDNRSPHEFHLLILAYWRCWMLVQISRVVEAICLL